MIPSWGVLEAKVGRFWRPGPGGTTLCINKVLWCQVAILPGSIRVKLRQVATAKCPSWLAKQVQTLGRLQNLTLEEDGRLLPSRERSTGERGAPGKSALRDADTARRSGTSKAL